MNAQQLSRYRSQLKEIVDRVGATAATLEEGVRTPLGGSDGGTSNAPLHLGDLGSEAYTQELDATLLENETYIRDEASAAIERIDAGDYGRCEGCGCAIPAARLAAIPYARYCVPCATRMQTGRAVNLNDGRPVGWLGEPGHEAASPTPQRVVGRDLGADRTDTYAAGTPGGGATVGGLGGTTVGDGSPADANRAGVNLEDAMASGTAEADEADAAGDEDEPLAESGPSGGAVGGTPANKRSKGGTPRSAKTKTTKPSSRRTKRSPE
ncbi:DnaK suppressor protein [Frigoriglobus tundricola]|uniref:DnaK suppressor protein n=2 Tax=Frigoriglobus tundricola TaxID=2774151 RepID=A0A6M5YYW5_9BACT|nr:DnaK suppressor protein [Frigoriglobus tundricola]